jgi:hypothetical protein
MMTITIGTIMTDAQLTSAMKMVEAYKTSPLKYRKARIEACRIQAQANPQAAHYWHFIADSLEQV